MKRIEICDLCLDDPLSIQAQTQITGGLLCQADWTLGQYVGYGAAAGAVAGGVGGFIFSGGPGVIPGALGGYVAGGFGGGLAWYLCK
jgi:hypothetical protein